MLLAKPVSICPIWTKGVIEMATFTSELKRIHNLIASEKYDRAVGDLEAMLDRYPGNAFLHCLLGQAIQLTEDGSLVVAEMHLRRACEYSQNDIRCLYELYRFLDATGAPEADSEKVRNKIKEAQELMQPLEL